MKVFSKLIAGGSMTDTLTIGGAFAISVESPSVRASENVGSALYTFIAGGCASYYSDFMGLFTVDIGASKDANIWHQGSAPYWWSC